MPRPKDYPRNLYVGSAAVSEIIDIMDKWFWMIEDGTAQNIYPKTSGIRITSKVANSVIEYIDGQTLYEVTSHPNYFMGMDLPAGFDRLKGHSRLAFVQEIFEAKKKHNLPIEHSVETGSEQA